MKMKNAISWFEIPTTDLQRARKFYEEIFQVKMDLVEMGNFKMCFFPLEDPMQGVGGTLVHTEGDFHKASATDGVVIYLNANPDVQNVLSRVEEAGGKIIVPKTEISPEYGFMGFFIDTEGNRVGVHSVPEKYLR